MRIILLLLLPPILLFGFALILMWLPLPSSFPVALSQGRNLIAAAMTGLLGIGYIVGLTLYLISSVRQAGRILDPLFASRGLASQSYLGLGRQYHGVVKDRLVEVNFTKGRVFQPDLLNLYVSADLGVRVAMGKQRPLLDCRDCSRVVVGEPGLNDRLEIYSESEAWVRDLLGESTVRSLVSRLMGNQKEHGFREIYLQPERIWLRAHPSSQVTEDDIEQWFDDLVALAEAAESLK